MEETAGLRKTVVRPGFVDLFGTDGLRTTFIGGSDVSLYYAGNRKLTLQATGLGPIVSLFDAVGTLHFGYTGSIPATATLEVLAGFIVGYS